MEDFFFTYVLFSEIDHKLYIGFSTDVHARFVQHENGEVLSTAPRRPLKLIYFEGHLSKEAALGRERYFKTTSGRRTLKIVLKDTLVKLNYAGL